MSEGIFVIDQSTPQPPTMMSLHFMEKAQNLSGTTSRPTTEGEESIMQSGLYEATKRHEASEAPIIYKCDAQRTKGDPTSPGYFLPVYTGMLNEV